MSVLLALCPPLQAMSWDDGYACYSTQDIQKIASANNPEHPMLIMLAHDGDNSFGAACAAARLHCCLASHDNALCCCCLVFCCFVVLPSMHTGGGYTYYNQCVKNLVNQAVSEGYAPTTVDQYLSDFPVDEDDIVGVRATP